MASTKEIRVKIRSIQSTQKITRAMEMVAASKMRKANERMRKARPYADHIFEVVRRVAQSQSEYRHSYLVARPKVKRVGIIVVSTDKGLCGSLNINVFKQTLSNIREWTSQGVHVDLCLFGRKANSFFGRKGFFAGVKGELKVVSSREHLGDNASITDLLGAVKVMLEAYEQDHLQRLFITFNNFVNTMSQVVKTEQLLPVPPLEEAKRNYSWDYIYEPGAKEILDVLLTRFIEAEVYRGVVENVACEQAARMVAMKAASDNAGELIQEFLLLYNKARQASITRELSEIVAGAASVA